ncbi:DUF397 domain-containing protein [Streptomyces sp. NPDC091267]|uniref:DUF397 domain-containing protein n=1 Tax=Streptomyces sp. NPDC091267 TaxID=3155195 RepID=UPI0034151242
MIRRTSAQDVSEPAWFKSSYSSNGNEGDCVEVAAVSGKVRVRDSKNAPGPQLAFGEDTWSDFVAHATAE